MEQWQIEALTKLLGGDTGSRATLVDVAQGRVYLHSSYFGDSRYHVVSRMPDGNVVIDQTDHGEKYQQRVTLEEEEVEPLLRTLLLWHLDKVRKGSESAQLSLDAEDALGDLDDHPF